MFRRAAACTNSVRVRADKAEALWLEPDDTGKFLWAVFEGCVKQAHSTKPWFQFPVGTPMERITVATSPVISVDERQRLRLIREGQRR